MSSETILVVDDAPVNLKLTDILLRKEGYKVHSAVDAEQALVLLRTCHPDLMLVDIQLPGMDGLELTRRIKQDSQTSDIVVVALTACAMKGDDDRAFRAGCDGYITKPIETLTLGRRVREYLDKRATPKPAPRAAQAQTLQWPGSLTLTGPEMESLRRRFLEESAVQVRRMLEEVDGDFFAAKFIQNVHEMGDAAALLEFQAVAVLAHEAERYLSEPADSNTLSEALTNLMISLVEPSEAGLGPIPAFISKALGGKRVALVGFREAEIERLCGAFERASAKPRLFDIVDSDDSDAIRDCSVALVSVRSETIGNFLLRPESKPMVGLHLVLAGPRSQILGLDPVVLSRAHEYLIDSWQPEEALMRVAFALTAKEAGLAPAAAPIAPSYSALTPSKQPSVSADAEVLIADDDLTVRMVVRGALQGAGIKCRMASNGTEALQMAVDCRPRAMVLDVNMPGMDGYEVLAAIRDQQVPVRVMLLTARQQECDITRGFTLGADDYMVKPFNPAELVARLKRFLWQ